MSFIKKEELIDELRKRYQAVEKWLSDAKKEEIRIRADSARAMLVEIKLTVDNLPTYVITENNRDTKEIR